MKRRAIRTAHTFGIAFQSILTLGIDIGIAILIGYIATACFGAQRWIYAPLIAAAAIIGTVSMIRFIISASHSLERFEMQHAADDERERNEICDEKRIGKESDENEQ